MVADDVVCICQLIDDIGVFVDDCDLIALLGELVNERDSYLASAHDHDGVRWGIHFRVGAKHD